MDITSLTQIGPYEVVRYVDAGAFAWVFEVRDPRFQGRRLALKMLMPEAAEGEELRRFESEARLLAQIDHPNVVTIFDFGRDEATSNFYYVMTFVDGPTLKTRLKEGPMSSDEALPIFVDLLDGLARIHDNGIVHRDIKPANVLLGQDGRVRLADLGIARVQDERGQTRTGVAVGTALYMSPEQARGREVDSRSDLFSIALTLYECLTGKVIYDHVESIDSTSGMDVLMYIGSLVHTQREFEVRFDAESKVPEPIQDIILKCLRLNPDDRFADAREMRDALRAVRDGSAVPVQPPVAASRPPSRVVLAAGAALAIALMGAGYYLLVVKPAQELAALREQVTTDLTALAALGESALGVASGVRDLEPPADPLLLERVDDHVDQGDRYLEDGAADLESGDLRSAKKTLDRGQREYLESCRLLEEQLLGARAGAESTALRDRAIGLSDRGAEEVVPAAWAKLAATLPRTEAVAVAAAGCAPAEQSLGRLQAVAEGVPLADAVETSMNEAWPRLLDSDYEAAKTAKSVADAVGSESREYKVALKEAKRFLLQGSRYRRSGDYVTARSAYRSAEKGFRVAAQISPAAAARVAAGALATEIEQENGTPIGDIAAQLQQADAAYAAEQWQQAEEGFLAAIVRLKDLRQATEWRRAAMAERARAETAQAAATEAGASRSAPTEFAQAEASMASAERGLEASDPKQAELAYAAAASQFAAAQQRAIQSLGDAGLRQANVEAALGELLAGRSCSDLAEEAGRADCAQAETAIAEGANALAALDAPAAQRSFSVALESLARARSKLVLWEATRPRPPELVRRVPQRSVVQASPRQVYTFAVEAHDPNGDLLTYSWTIDGQVQSGEQGPTLRRRLEQSGVIAVTVDDGRGGALEQSWQVDVVERQ